jgi:hypothetical protein
MSDIHADHVQPHQARDRSLRASDEDRDAIASVLGEQHLAGRLESDEFQERLDRCYAAKTYGELDGLVADLPREEPARQAPRRWRPYAIVLLPLLIAAVALSGGHLLWLAIPLLFFVGRPLLWRSTGGRFGWGPAGCGTRGRVSSGTYI